MLDRTGQHVSSRSFAFWYCGDADTDGDDGGAWGFYREVGVKLYVPEGKGL